MAVDLASDALSLLALMALLLWPGLLVVRSPGRLVPFLSASFWLLSAWWTPASAARSTFLGAALLAFFLLSLLRLLKPISSWPPRWPTVAVVGLAVMAFLPLVGLTVAPGLSLASAEATLLVWRDGWPASYEPLLPIPAFGAHAPGLPLLAADVARLSGVSPARAVVFVSLAALGLLVLATETCLRRAARPGLGLLAAAALLGGGLLVLSQGGKAPGPAVLSLSLGLAALGILVTGTGRSPAVAAGLLLGAALTVEAAVAAALTGVALFGGGPGRRRLAVVLGLALAGPRLVVLIRALQPAEMRAWAAEALTEVGGRPPQPDPGALRAMTWLRTHSHPLDRVCIDPRSPGAFVPALASRATDPPEVPPVYRQESRSPRTPCRFVAVFGRNPGPGPLVPPGAKAVYEDLGTVVMETGAPSHPLTPVPGTSRPGPAVERQ